MKALSEVKTGETTELRAIYDENGNITKYEEVKVEAPKEEKPKEEEEEEEEEDVVILDSEPVGMTEEDLEEEEKAAKEAAKKQAEENKEKQAELSRKAAELANIPEGPERDAARKKLLEECVIAQGPVETMTYTRTRV
jgi:hypothetical protein